MTSRRRRRITVVLSLVTGACASASGDDGSESVRHSAERSDGAIVDQLASVEDAAFSGGRWYLADSKTGQIVVLDSAARVIRTIGRRGSGPGEFRAPRAVAAAGDRVYAADLGRNLVHVFDSSGSFLRSLAGARQCGQIVALAAADSDVFALRRCVGARNSIVLTVEAGSNQSLVEWPELADTISVPDNSPVPINFPVIAASAEFVVVGDGATGCVRRFASESRRASPARCFSEVPRLPTPDSLRSRLSPKWAGRLSVPDSLPRLIRISLLDSTVALQVPNGPVRTTWIEAYWVASTTRPLGAPATEMSFLSAAGQLIISEDSAGLHASVVPLRR